MACGMCYIGNACATLSNHSHDNLLHMHSQETILNNDPFNFNSFRPLSLAMTKPCRNYQRDWALGTTTENGKSNGLFKIMITAHVLSDCSTHEHYLNMPAERC